MPAEDTVTRPRQKDSLDATVKKYVERRSRKAARTQVTAVTRDDTVQHCSPISQTPVPPSGVYFNLENNEDEMGPELEKLESSSAVTGLETPGRQCPPNEGVSETGRITANGFLTAGVDSRKKGNISSSSEQATRTVTAAGISSITATPSKRRHKHSTKRTSSLTTEGKERRPALGRGCTLLSFRGRAGKLLAVFCLYFVLCAPCVFVFRNYFFSTGDYFSAKLKDGTRALDADRVADVRNRRASVLSPITLLKLARTSKAGFDRSANAIDF